MKNIALSTICLLLAATAPSSAQTYLKWNAAYWAVGLINMSAETRLGDHFTLSGEVVYSPWKSLDGNPFRFLQFNPDLRWYPAGAFKGFYAGAYATLQDFKISKWGYWNTDKYQDGWGYGFGAMIGLQTDIGRRWNLDVYLGGGWHHGEYRGFYKSSGQMYKDWNGSGEWLPYKLGITFAYRLGRGRSR